MFNIALAGDLTDWELWACAQQVAKQHQLTAAAHLGSRIGELAAAGDIDGVQT